MALKLAKLVKWAVGRYGVRGTLMLVPNYVVHRAAYRLIEGWIAFDRPYGTDTTAIVDAMHFGVTPDETKGAHIYMACAPWVVKRALATIEHAGFTFVDYGCGKGRALLVASTLDFSRIVGIDLSPKLCAIAEENAKRFRPPERGAMDIEICCMDARAFTPPRTDIVYFFFNPFNAAVLDEVLTRIRASLTPEHRAYLVFQNEEPAAPALRRAAWLTLHHREKIGPRMGSWSVYSATHEERPTAPQKRNS